MKEHLTDYLAADDSRRAEVSRRLEDASGQCVDTLGGNIPCGAWRHQWPPGVRKAILALWRTPKDE